MPSQEDIQQVVEIIKTRCRSKPMDDVVRGLASIMSPDLIAEARKVIAAEAHAIRVLKDPPAIEASDLAAWYPGPSGDSLYWPRVQKRLSSQWGNVGAIERLDRESTRVVADLHNPHLPRFSTRGLVAGDVQSGKTSNFTAVISKAADAGYRAFIVLSGTKNKLRRQTQHRLLADLVGPDTRDWMVLTTEEHDFGVGNTPSANAVLANSATLPVLLVVKKNSTVLHKLLRWLRGAHDDIVLQTPALVIDDEADEASINVAKTRDERTRVNGSIVDLLKLFKRVAFVGYTATPYANFFIDASAPEDLYPRDFIIPLGSSPEYFGYERIFGRERTRYDENDRDIDGLDMIRSVTAQEAAAVKPERGQTAPFKLDLRRAPALQEALDWFLLSTAARIARGQGDKHSSMLIHTSQLTAIHRTFSTPIEKRCRQIHDELEGGNPTTRKRLGDLWDREIRRVDAAQFGYDALKFSDVEQHLVPVLKRARVIVENSMTVAEQRLVYGSTPGVFIVIGGDVLSRGLTLEGLVVSYFTRSATTFDTLMQMGRWFGYRRGYCDLPRIWMTDDLKSSFYEIGGIDREMRQQIERTYAGRVTPRDFAPMVRTHPSLAITSRMKMQGQLVKRRLSYGNRRVQTILFSPEKKWLKDNIDATKNLLSQCSAEHGRAIPSVVPSRLLFRNVQTTSILRFLGAYRFHEESWNLNVGALTSYIEAENRANGLAAWNVVVVEGEDHECETLDLLEGRPVRTIVRSKISAPDLPYFNIKSLVSEDDFVADFLARPSEFGSFEDVIAARNSQMPGMGLLVIYPIDRKSPPAREGRKTKAGEVRVPLNAELPVIGVSLAFPKQVSNLNDGIYITQDLTRVEVEAPEEMAEEEQET